MQLLVSRVLSRTSVTLGTLAVIPLGRPLPNASCSLPRGSGRQPSNAPLHGLAPDGVCLAATVTGCAVGSYPTFSPLPEAPKRPGRSNFLWHFPRGFPHRALPGVLLCGARTFLPTSGAERSPLLRRRGGSYHGRGAPARGVSIVVRLSMVRDPAQRRDQATSGGHSAAIRRSGARQARGRAGSTQRRCRGCPPGGRLAADRCGRALRRPPRRAAGPP